MKFVARLCGNMPLSSLQEEKIKISYGLKSVFTSLFLYAIICTLILAAIATKAIEIPYSRPLYYLLPATCFFTLFSLCLILMGYLNEKRMVVVCSVAFFVLNLTYSIATTFMGEAFFGFEF